MKSRFLEAYNIRLKSFISSREVGHFALGTGWLAIAYEVRTRIICLDEDITIPELGF